MGELEEGHIHMHQWDFSALYIWGGKKGFIAVHVRILYLGGCGTLHWYLGRVSKLQITMVVLMRMVLRALSSKNQGNAHGQKLGEYWPSLAARPNFSLPLIKFKRGLAGLGCFKGYHGIPFLVPKLIPPVGFDGNIFTSLVHWLLAGTCLQCAGWLLLGSYNMHSI